MHLQVRHNNSHLAKCKLPTLASVQKRPSCYAAVMSVNYYCIVCVAPKFDESILQCLEARFGEMRGNGPHLAQIQSVAAAYQYRQSNHRPFNY